MAKEKKEKTEETDDAKKLALKDIYKEYGEDIICDANLILEEKQTIIPVSPVLDIGLCGGIPTGSWVVCSGKPKAGKSTLVLQFAANFQKTTGQDVYYLDVEGRLKPMNINSVKDLNLTKFHRIRSSKNRILEAEDYLNILEKILKRFPNVLVIVDSISALCSSSENLAEFSSTRRADGPKLLAMLCRKLGNVVPVQNSILWLIQHVMANTSGYGASTYEDGGNKIKYQVDVKLRTNKFEKWEEGGKTVGIITNWNIETSALGPPVTELSSYIRFGEGIDKVKEVIETATNFGLIEKGGAWYKVGEQSFQGQEKLYQYFKNNPTELDKLFISLKELLTCNTSVSMEPSTN